MLNAKRSTCPGLLEQFGNQPGPPRLVAGTDASARVVVKVLVEQRVVAPVLVVKCLAMYYLCHYNFLPHQGNRSGSKGGILHSLRDLDIDLDSFFVLDEVALQLGKAFQAIDTSGE